MLKKLTAHDAPWPGIILASIMAAAVVPGGIAIAALLIGRKCRHDCAMRRDRQARDFERRVYQYQGSE